MVQQNARQAIGAIRAAVMARVSTAEQARGDKTSLEDQIAKGRAEVAKRGWALHDTFTDVFTGASSDRPELAQIIAAACEGTIQAVVFTKVDRLARDLRDLFNIEAQLARHGVAIVATDQPIDTSTPPYGLRLAAGKLEHDPDEAKVVNKAAAMLVEDGLTLTECADKLNADGSRPRKAPRWDVTALRWMLSNEALAGTVVWAKPARTVQPDRPRRGHRTTGRYGGPIEIPVPAILDRATFDRIQAILAETAQDGRAANRVYMLSGRLTAPCGRLYRGWWRNDRSRRLYRCAGYSEGCRCRTLYADDVERLVWDEIVRVLQAPERVIELARAWTRRVDGARIDTQRLDRRIASLQAALERAYTAGLTSGLDPEALQAATASIAADLATLRRERSTLKIAQADAAETRRRLVGLRELAVRLDTMSVLDRARLVRLLDVCARVTGFCEETADWPYRFTLHIEGVIPLSAAGDPWDARTGGASAHPAAAATR